MAMLSLKMKLRWQALIVEDPDPPWLLFAEGEQLPDVGRTKSLLRRPDCEAPSRKVQSLNKCHGLKMMTRFLADFLISVVTAIFEDQISMDSLIVQVMVRVEVDSSTILVAGDASRTQVG